MCCFTRPVQSVSNTNIFARPDKDGRQFLVYSMSVAAKEDVAMVLPLPVQKGATENSVHFIDLKGYPSFFTDLIKGFPPPPAAGDELLTRSVPASASATLQVVQVGDFEASFVPTTGDFSRLDERFRLPEDVWKSIPAYRDYGFTVFKLKPGTARIHPMAFSFPRANASSLFFPTVHIHDGKLYPRARFDHVLYCQSSPEEGYAVHGWAESSRPANAFMKMDLTKDLIDGGRHCYRKTLRGVLPNKDTVIPRA